MAIPARGVVTVIGCVMFYMTLGMTFTFGNMDPYITSYLRMAANQEVTLVESTWIFAFSCMAAGITMFFGGLLSGIIGPRLTIMIGGIIRSSGTMLSYFTVQHSLIPMVVTYGVMFGCGLGFSYAVILSAAISWFPQKRGLISGFVFAGSGFGTLIWDEFQTNYINPSNLKPNYTAPGSDGSEKYFDEPDMLYRTPWCMLIMGAICLFLQLTASIMVSVPGRGFWSCCEGVKCNCCSPSDEEKAIINKQKRKPSKTQKLDRSYLVKDEEGSSDSEAEIEPSPEVAEGERITKSINYQSISTNKEAPLIPPDGNFTPTRMLKHPNFWILYVTFLLNCIGVNYVTTLYKDLAQGKIDDQFLALTGALACALNGFARMMWGLMCDYVRYKYLMCLLTLMMTGLLFSYHITVNYTAFYFVWTLLLFITFCGNFPLMMVCCSKMFGTKHLSVNFGILFTAYSFAGLLATFTATQTKKLIQYQGVFSIGGGCSAVSFFLTLFYRDGLPLLPCMSGNRAVVPSN